MQQLTNWLIFISMKENVYLIVFVLYLEQVIIYHCAFNSLGEDESHQYNKVISIYAIFYLNFS